MNPLPVDVLAVGSGLVVVVAATSSVLRTLVMPRGLRSMVAGSVTRTIQGGFHAVAHRLRGYEQRDALLAWSGPVTILVTLVVWLLMFLFGYALMLVGFSDVDLPTAVREAGSSLFTLGFASSDRAQLTAVDFVAAATGPIVIGLLIGYLPSLYASYNRREVEVTLLVARAGEPSWGPELIARHVIVDSLAELPTLWTAWERWAADVSESHTTYPVLMDIRSTRPLRHWLVALLSVLDAAAIDLAARPSVAQAPSRVVLRQGIVCLRDLADIARIPVDRDPSPEAPVAVTFEEFAAAYDSLVAAGYPAERTAAQAWPHWRGWRVNYEAPAFALAERLDAPPALWSGPRTPPSPQLPPWRPPNRQPRTDDTSGNDTGS